MTIAMLSHENGVNGVNEHGEIHGPDTPIAPIYVDVPSEEFRDCYEFIGVFPSVDDALDAIADHYAAE